LDKVRAGRSDRARVESAAPLECVALLLVRDRRVLAEKRTLTKRPAPRVSMAERFGDGPGRPGLNLAREGVPCHPKKRNWSTCCAR
jgi:hypothetical protein